MEIYLGDELVGHIDPNAGQDELEDLVILIDGPDIFDQPTIVLRFLFDAPTSGMRRLLDDLELVAVELKEEPSDVPVLPWAMFTGSVIAGLGLLARRRRRRVPGKLP